MSGCHRQLLSYSRPLLSVRAATGACGDLHLNLLKFKEFTVQFLLAVATLHTLRSPRWLVAAAWDSACGTISVDAEILLDSAYWRGQDLLP